MMSEIFAQGERVPDVLPSGTVSQNAEGAAMVLAEDEASGHRNAIRERVTMFRDDSLAAKDSGLAPHLHQTNLNSDNLPALGGLSARKSHELVLLEHSMVAVLQPRLVHDHHAQS
jgi:hypothetical protein